MEPKQLEAMCAKWQGILRLQDWDVEVAFVRQPELSDSQGDVDARTWPILSRKEAKIKILDPIDFTGERLKDAGSCENIEMLLIHELLHLHFEPFWDGDKKNEMEQAIHSLAKAFITTTKPGRVLVGEVRR